MPKGSLCALRTRSNTQAGSLPPCLHLLFGQSLRASQRESLQHSQVFTGMCRTTGTCQSCACTWPSRFPGIYCTISKSLWTSYSSAFPFNFLKWVLSGWLFAPTVITALGNYSVKQWLLRVLIKAWGKSCLSCASPESSQIKTNPGSGISQGGIRTNYDKSLGMGFEGTPTSFHLF